MSDFPALLSLSDAFSCDNESAPEGAGNTDSGARPTRPIREVSAVTEIVPPPIHETLNRPRWADEFWYHVAPVDNGCWEWVGTTGSGGYGAFSKGNWGTARAHRIAYMWSRGPIPAGRVIDHLCRNRACVRPIHLEAVTERENILRGVGAPAQNARVEKCKRGHDLSGDNLIDYKLAVGERQCRLCQRERSRVRHYLRPTESANAGSCSCCGLVRHVRKDGLINKHRQVNGEVCPGSHERPGGDAR